MHWMLMPLRRYADFSGRSRRMEFWMWQLFKFLFGCVIGILFVAMFGSVLMGFETTKDPAALMAAGGGLLLLWMVCMIVGLAIFIPDLAVTVRRLHDTNRSGWWILAPLVPYVVFWGATLSTMSMGQPPEPPTGIVAIVAIVAMLAMFGCALLLLVFYFLDGTPGANRFGPDPKGRGGDPGVFA